MTRSTPTRTPQQTQGVVSMLPQQGTLEIDPDERLEREAEQTAQDVMQGGKLGIQRMPNGEVHVQRATSRRGFMSSVTNMFSGDDGASEAASESSADASSAETDFAFEQVPTEGAVDDQLATLASNQQQLQANQQALLETVVAAEPGTPSMDPAKAAVKGIAGKGVGAMAGAAVGSVVPVVGTSAGMLAGAMASDVVKDWAGMAADMTDDDVQDMHTRLRSLDDRLTALEETTEHGGNFKFGGG